MFAPTELDYCVLAVIGRNGPLSAYGVRQHFVQSATAAWSASSGSIYPAIRRLLAAELVRATEPTDRRGTRVLTITSIGRNAIHDWLLTVSDPDGTATSDPIRTRAQFLSFLNDEQRAQFFKRSESVTRDALAGLRRKLANPPHSNHPELETIGMRGAIAELSARLEWLDDTRRTLAKSGQDTKQS